MLFNYGEKLMAKILEFKLPQKACPPKADSNLFVSSSIDDVMLIIHHALHGTDDKFQPKDLRFAAQLLDELSTYINNISESNDSSNDNQDDCLVLSRDASKKIAARYPKLYYKQSEKGGG